MRLDKKFKQEVKMEVRKRSYIANKVIRKILVWILVLTVLAVASVGFKTWSVYTDRIIFKQSITYNEGVLDDLAKYRFEMIQAKDEIEKKAIAELVVQRFANYDESKIETRDLKQFLKDCRNLNLEDY